MRMPRAALTQEAIEDFRQRAVEAATRLFAEHGVDAVTMRRLAAELGCSPMTPYRYFENRDALFTMVRIQAFARFADRQRDAAQSTLDPEARLKAIKDAYIEFALSEPAAYRIMFSLRERAGDDQPELIQESLRGFSYFREAVAVAIEAGLLKGDPESRAQLLWAQAHGLVSLHLSGKLAIGRTIHQLADAIFPLI